MKNDNLLVRFIKSFQQAFNDRTYTSAQGNNSGYHQVGEFVFYGVKILSNETGIFKNDNGDVAHAEKIQLYASATDRTITSKYIKSNPYDATVDDVIDILSNLVATASPYVVSTAKVVDICSMIFNDIINEQLVDWELIMQRTGLSIDSVIKLMTGELTPTLRMIKELLNIMYIENAVSAPQEEEHLEIITKTKVVPMLKQKGQEPHSTKPNNLCEMFLNMLEAHGKSLNDVEIVYVTDLMISVSTWDWFKRLSIIRNLDVTPYPYRIAGNDWFIIVKDSENHQFLEFDISRDKDFIKMCQ